jgi:hypothetical protein
LVVVLAFWETNERALWLYLRGFQFFTAGVTEDEAHLVFDTVYYNELV